MCHTVRRRVAHAETVPDGDPEPVVTKGSQTVDVAGDAADLLVDLDPVAGRVLGHLNDVVGSQVGSKRKSCKQEKMNTLREQDVFTFRNEWPIFRLIFKETYRFFRNQTVKEELNINI